MSTEAEIAAVKRYQSKRDAIMLRPPIERGELIRAAAAAAGQSVTAYIMEAIQARMDNDSRDD